jgi:type IV secretory pathway TrbD component
MHIRGHYYRVDWWHLAFATLAALGCVIYLADARSVSTSPENILLVQPTALIAVALYFLILPQCFHRADRLPAEGEQEDQIDRSEAIRVGSLAAALGLFGFSIETIGFDVSIWLFVLAAMFISGERKPLSLIVYPLIVTVATIYAFRALLPFPMPTILL